MWGKGCGGFVEAKGLAAVEFGADGSKSTNQLWNSARAIASSVAFIRRFNSILSSSAPSTAAMAFVRRGWDACLVRQDASW